MHFNVMLNDYLRRSNRSYDIGTQKTITATGTAMPASGSVSVYPPKIAPVPMQSISANSLYIDDDLYETQSLKTPKEPKIRFVVTDYRSEPFYHGWSVTFKLVDLTKDDINVDILEEHKALITAEHKWFTFDGNVPGDLVMDETTKSLMIDGIRLYLNDLFTGLRTIEENTSFGRAYQLNIQKMMSLYGP